MSRPKNINSLNHIAAKSSLKYVDLGTKTTDTVIDTEGFLCSFTCLNSNADADVRYIQFYDQNVDVVVGQTDFFDIFVIPASGAQIIFGEDYFTKLGYYLSNGLAWAFSTTKNSFTEGLASDQVTIINYKK